ncbi:MULTISPECIES: hypothetical protein [Alphaproteobacteria]|uniref:Uncharacterized protein n=2 Tax=Alphaproteobacteria TaxID=28211 RepID=A0A512HD06_9HYPH|nr:MULTISPECIES: hypothetical protein [Alphaproteobacteria]GEO83336.1 hypothetical protein RNA01_02680 [Ciceribacter naphthalenivorans]GLR20270.1 hypothetical protein GCM10007920_00540 [Ciceribacter naphthalenivorans]GLT03126.1 hypothetical protein GCM10007926_00540 [Sphingomonas psychrolutea]
MHDKVTMINLVWVGMMTAMLATSATFYMSEKADASNYGPQLARYYPIGR